MEYALVVSDFGNVDRYQSVCTTTNHASQKSRHIEIINVRCNIKEAQVHLTEKMIF